MTPVQLFCAYGPKRLLLVSLTCFLDNYFSPLLLFLSFADVNSNRDNKQNDTQRAKNMQPERRNVTHMLQILDDQKLEYIAASITPDWRYFANRLGYSKEECDKFQAREVATSWRPAFNMLCHWQDHDEIENTVNSAGLLVRMLRRKGYNETAGRIERWLNEA